MHIKQKRKKVKSKSRKIDKSEHRQLWKSKQTIKKTGTGKTKNRKLGKPRNNETQIENRKIKSANNLQIVQINEKLRH